MNKTKKLAIFILIQLVFLSCASISFNVDHPPLIDLRGANSITVIPLEWDSIIEYKTLSNRVTYALLSGISRGNITVIDPYSQENNYIRNYSRYADIYILGKITNVMFNDDVKTREDKSWSETRIITTITRTVYVSIEYSYYKSANNQILGRFNKTASSSDSVEHTRRASERPNRQDYTNREPNQSGRSGTTRRTRNNVRRQLDEWTYNIAAAAVPEFSGTMNNELSQWTTMEKRRVRGSATGEPDAAEAKKLIRESQYKQALDKFTAVYVKNNNVSFGYNTAILLAANNRFAEALALLEKIDKTITEAGKKSPAYIKKEITKMTGYIDGFKILQSARPAPSAQTAAPASAPIPAKETIRPSQTTYRTEYDYNAAGEIIAQRDYNNGILERQVLIQGRREVEELYINGVIVLRAIWENGVKISEERIPKR